MFMYHFTLKDESGSVEAVGDQTLFDDETAVRKAIKAGAEAMLDKLIGGHTEARTVVTAERDGVILAAVTTISSVERPS